MLNRTLKPSLLKKADLMKVRALPAKRLRSFLLAVAILFAVTTPTAAQQNRRPHSQKVKPYPPYCGLRCLYAVLRFYDRPVEFAALLKPEYVGSRRGSSLAELKRAAEDYDLQARSVRNLTTRVMKEAPYLVILHVKSSMDKDFYDHFELFLGTKEGKAMIFDPPEPVRLVPFCELAPRWDGTGLIVSAEPIELNGFLAPSRYRFVAYAAVSLVLVLMVRRSRQRWLPRLVGISRLRSLELSVGQGVAFGFVALLGGMLYHFANDEGLLANAKAVASIQEAHLGNFIPKIGIRKVERMLKEDAVIIDARFARDCKKG
ncbi:MAG: cysteine peptidase family C39 domain-containing protein, partial [Planctomycetota bacterium]